MMGVALADNPGSGQLDTECVGVCLERAFQVRRSTSLRGFVRSPPRPARAAPEWFRFPVCRDTTKWRDGGTSSTRARVLLPDDAVGRVARGGILGVVVVTTR
jgi:hypothetical protein